MLRHIPFYGTLLGRELTPGGIKATHSHVLVYGAIEAHDRGDLGCIASNQTLADEIGMKLSTVKTALSQLNAAGWVKVEMKSNNVRQSVVPMLDLIVVPAVSVDKPGVSVHKPDRLSTLTIEDSVDSTKKIDTDVSMASRPEEPDAGDGEVVDASAEQGDRDLPAKQSEHLTHGNDTINRMFDAWRDRVGYPIEAARQKNRYACNNLLKKYGEDGLTKLLDGVALANADRFGPNIADFAELQAKLNQLVRWGRSRTQQPNQGNVPEFH